MAKGRKYPKEYRQEVLLPDGEKVVLRRIKGGDEKAMVGFHQRLGELTVRLRYFETMSLEARIEKTRLKRICEPELNREYVIVADVDGEIVGVARLEDGLSGEKAEYAVILADDWQGRGLGREMMEKLIELAKEKGLLGIYAEIMPGNRGMRKLAVELGFKLLDDYEEGTTFTVLDF